MTATVTDKTKPTITYARVSVWKVELTGGFRVDLVWLKDDDPDFAKMFGDDYVSAVQIGRDGLMNPAYLMYVNGEIKTCS